MSMKDIVLEELLKEIGTRGSRTIAGALATMAGTVSVEAKAVDVVPMRSIVSSLGGQDALLAGAYFHFTGELDAAMMLLMKMDSMKALASRMVPGGWEGDRSHMAVSSIKELANVVTSSAINIFSDLFSWRLTPTPGVFMLDSGGAIMDFAARDRRREAGEALLIALELRFVDAAAGCVLLLMMDDEGLDTLFTRFFHPGGRGRPEP